MHATDHGFLRIVRVALGCMLLVSIVLSGCSPAVEPTMPPATKMANNPAPTVAPATAEKPAPAPPTPTAVPPTKQPPTVTPIPPTVEPTEAPSQRKTVSITILHTNDAMGEIDPCG